MQLNDEFVGLKYDALSYLWFVKSNKKVHLSVLKRIRFLIFGLKMQLNYKIVDIKRMRFVIFGL